MSSLFIVIPAYNESENIKKTIMDWYPVVENHNDEGQSRLVRRAIMANTLEKIPVFFSTPQEVADYISQSLMLCDDEAEKYASKQLIQEMMG